MTCLYDLNRRPDGKPGNQILNPREAPFSELGKVAFIPHAVPSPRDDAKSLYPALIGARMREGGSRRNEDCEGRDVLFIDLDGGKNDAGYLSYDDAVARLYKLGYEAWIHSSASHTAEANKCHIFIHLNREYTEAEWDAVKAWAQRIFPECDPAGLRYTQPAYLPIDTPGYRCDYIVGEPLNIYGNVAAPAPAVDDINPPSSVVVELRVAPTQPTHTAPLVSAGHGVDLDAYEALLREVYPGAGSHKCHGWRVVITGFSIQAGMPWEQVAGKLPEQVEGDERASMCRDTAEKLAKGTPVYSRGALAATIGQANADRLATILSCTEEQVYERGQVAAAGPLMAALAAAREKATELTPDGPFKFGDWNREPEPVEWLVDGVIPKGQVGVIVGYGSSKKSWMLMSLGVAVATGKPWCGHAVKKGRAAHLDYEQGPTIAYDRVRILSRCDACAFFGYAFGAGDIHDAAWWASLPPLDMLTIDSLRAGSRGRDENDSRIAEALMLAREYAVRTGATVIFIHHETKNVTDVKRSGRGSGAIYDQSDFQYRVQSDAEYDAPAFVEVSKPFRRGRSPMPFAFRVDDALGVVAVTSAPRPTERSTVRVKDSLRDQIWRFCDQDDPKSKNDIVKHCTGDSQVIRKAVDLMVHEGELIQVEGGGYSLFQTHKPALARVLEAIKVGGGSAAETDVINVCRVTKGQLSALTLAGQVKRSDGSYWKGPNSV